MGVSNSYFIFIQKLFKIKWESKMTSLLSLYTLKTLTLCWHQWTINYIPKAFYWENKQETTSFVRYIHIQAAKVENGQRRRANHKRFPPHEIHIKTKQKACNSFSAATFGEILVKRRDDAKLGPQITQSQGQNHKKTGPTRYKFSIKGITSPSHKLHFFFFLHFPCRSIYLSFLFFFRSPPSRIHTKRAETGGSVASQVRFRSVWYNFFCVIICFDHGLRRSTRANRRLKRWRRSGSWKSLRICRRILLHHAVPVYHSLSLSLSFIHMYACICLCIYVYVCLCLTLIYPVLPSWFLDIGICDSLCCLWLNDVNCDDLAFIFG